MCCACVPSPMRGRLLVFRFPSSNAPRSVGFSLGWRSCHQARRAQMTDEGGRDNNLLGKVAFFPLIRQFSRWSNCHLPPREGFCAASLLPRIAASPRGKAFGRPHPMKQCAAQAFLPLLRGRWREAPDEVVDVNDRPLIRLFSLRSKILPLRHSRIGARLKKPSRLAFSYASRPTGGEKAFGSALPSNAPRSVGFSLGWRS